MVSRMAARKPRRTTRKTRRKARNAAAPDFEKQIAELKQASADERIDFKLQLAGCRNVKAARAVLDDYEGDIDKMKEAELWLFAKHLGDSKGATGKTVQH